MAAAIPEATHTEWTRVLRDLRPHEIMHTVARRKPAVHAAWLARAVDDDALLAYADHWHQAGWSPNEWWMLAASVKVARAETRRELGAVLHPDDWAGWRELAAEHGARTATVVLLDASDITLEAKLHWATAEEKFTKPGLGRPGEPLV